LPTVDGELRHLKEDSPNDSDVRLDAVGEDGKMEFRLKKDNCKERRFAKNHPIFCGSATKPKKL